MAAAKKKPEAGKRLDLTFLSFVLILLTTGLVMLFSASYAYSYEYYGNSYKFITRQAAFAAAGAWLLSTPVWPKRLPRRALLLC